MEEVTNNTNTDTEIEETTAAADVPESPKPDPATDNTVADSEVDPPSAPADETPVPNGLSSPKGIPVSAPEESTVESNKEPEVAEPSPAENDGVKSNGEVQKTADAAESVSPAKKQEKIDDEVFPPEVDSVVVPPHWHAKPCVHLTSIGGFVTEQFQYATSSIGIEDSVKAQDRVTYMICRRLNKKAINIVANKLDGRLLLMNVGLFISAHRNQVGLCLLSRYILPGRSETHLETHLETPWTFWSLRVAFLEVHRSCVTCGGSHMREETH